MSSSGPERHRRPGFKPFGAVGVAILHAKVVSGITRRREHHVRGALGSDDYIEALQRDTGVENAAEQPPMIGDRPHEIVLGVPGRDGLGMEEVRVDEINMLRAEMKRGRDDLFR